MQQREWISASTLKKIITTQRLKIMGFSCHRWNMLEETGL